MFYLLFLFNTKLIYRMMNNRVFTTVKTILNTDGRGNFKPSDYDLIVNNVVNELYEENLLELNKYLNKENRGLISNGLENLSDNTRQKLMHYADEASVIISARKHAIPTNLRWIDTITNQITGFEYEQCSNTREFNATKTVASSEYPICMKNGAFIKTFPEVLLGQYIVIDYLRNPLFAKWTYQVISDVEIFNPSATDFQDIDIHPSEESNVILRVLQKFGINLKEVDIQNITNTQEQMEMQNENNI